MMNNCRPDNRKNPDILRHGYTGVLIVLAVFWIAGVLLAGNSFAQSQDKNAKGSTTNTKRDALQGNTKQLPIVVNVLPTPKTEEETKREQEERKQKAELDRKLVDLTGDLARYTSDLATFTKVLAGIGLLQLLVFAFQSWQLKRTVDSAENESMPFLFPVIIDRATGLIPSNNRSPYKPFVRVVFDNYGKTPAVIKSLLSELRLVTGLPNKPEYDGRTVARHFVAVIPAETRHDVDPLQLPTTVSTHDTISIDEWDTSQKKMSEGSLRFFLFGEVIYDDFFERRHTFGFCIKIFLGGGQWLSGPAKYHYIKHSSAPKEKIEPQEEPET